MRAALFERRDDVGDPDVLAQIATAHALATPATGTSAAVQADYDGGRALGVKGSPHYFVASDDFFCPALELGHDPDGQLTARFDADMLADFFAHIDAEAPGLMPQRTETAGDCHHASCFWQSAEFTTPTQIAPGAMDLGRSSHSRVALKRRAVRVGAVCGGGVHIRHPPDVAHAKIRTQCVVEMSAELLLGEQLSNDL